MRVLPKLRPCLKTEKLPAFSKTICARKAKKRGKPRRLPCILMPPAPLRGIRRLLQFFKQLMGKTNRRLLIQLKPLGVFGCLGDKGRCVQSVVMQGFLNEQAVGQKKDQPREVIGGHLAGTLGDLAGDEGGKLAVAA